LLFVVIAILIGCVQLILQYAVLSRMLTPLQRLVGMIRENLGEVPEVVEENYLGQIRKNLAALKSMTERSSLMPREIEELTVVVTQILVSLEKAWDQAAATTTLTAMGSICSQVAHDIRSPLAGVRIFLEKSPSTENEKWEELRRYALQATDRMVAMADELLEFRRTQEIESREFDLASLVKTVCAELEPLAEGRRVQMVYEGPFSLAFTGDASKLSRVFHNLA